MSYVISESNFSQLVIEAVGPAAITNVTALSICCVGGCLKGNLVLSKPETMEHSSADYMRPLDFHAPLLCMDIFQQVSLTFLFSFVWQYFCLVYSNNIVSRPLKSHPS